MLKTFFASTAIVTTLGFAALAQEAADPLVKEPEAQAPAEMAPSAPAPTTGAQSAEPATPMAVEPEAETAKDPAASPMSAEPPAETAEDPAATPMSPDPATATAPDPASSPGMMTAPTAEAEPTLTPLTAADMSADELIGAKIQTRDAQDIADVEDVLMRQDGTVESVVAQFGGFLGFGSNKVLLTLDEIEVLQDEAGTLVVQTDLTPEALEGRPEYQAEQ